MAGARRSRRLTKAVHEFVRKGFRPRFGELGDSFPTGPVWRKLNDLGTELWLDTGSLEEAAELWTREFSALTTNNTLLNHEVQKGTYDGLIREAADLLAGHKELTDRDRMLEIAFILNARHGLKLVERFDAFVSVEEHTDLAHDVTLAVEYGERYHAICPERFVVKVPFTPAGLLATRRLSAEGVPVNHTLGFSARQNYVIARLGRPAYVNVFLGRLNAFVADNALGDGTYVGERAVLASQKVVRDLRRTMRLDVRQIGASFRAGGQVRDLAGLDVMTVPPKVARQFLELSMDPQDLADRTEEMYRPPLAEGIDANQVRLDTLWDVDAQLPACVDAVEHQAVEGFSPEELVAFFDEHGCGDLLVPWTDDQIRTSAEEGKIPRLSNWTDPLAGRTIGLDSLMNLAGLNSFAADQKAMDDRVAHVLEAAPAGS